MSDKTVMTLNIITAILFTISGILNIFSGNKFSGILMLISAGCWYFIFICRLIDYRKKFGYKTNHKENKKRDEDRKTLDYYTKK